MSTNLRLQSKTNSAFEELYVRRTGRSKCRVWCIQSQLQPQERQLDDIRESGNLLLDIGPATGIIYVTYEESAEVFPEAPFSR